MKFLGGYITYTGKGVPNLIYEKMERGLKNIDSCLVRDERKVRIYKDYFLPANRFILSIHDLTNSDLSKLDALTHRFLKSWLGMPQSASFLPVHSGCGMDVKSISHLYKESRTLDMVKALIRGRWKRKSAISVRAAEIAGSILSSSDPATDTTVESPPWSSMTPNLKIPCHLKASYAHSLGILIYHCTLTQLRSMTLHNRHRLSSLHHTPSLSQKCRLLGGRLEGFFRRKRMLHGLLAFVSLPCMATFLVCCRLKKRALCGSSICGNFLVVF